MATHLVPGPRGIDASEVERAIDAAAGDQAKLAALPTAEQLQASLNAKANASTPIVGSGLVIATGTIGGSPAVGVIIASQAEAVAGTVNDRAITPLRAAQAIAAAPPSSATTTALAGKAATDLSNIVSGAANTLLGQLSTTQGAVAYRSATGWTALAPGAMGTFLQANGPNANPTWSTTTSAVTSVAGKTGAVTLAAADIADSTTTGRSLLTTASASAGRGTLGAAAAGANGDITALSGLTTALSILQGGTGATTAAAALAGLGGAPTASPTFTGTPAAPTAAVDTSTTQIATAAFVLGQAASAAPAMDGTAAAGTSTRFARGDHVHPSDTSRAPLSSPALTGTPSAPTAAVDTNTTQLATTAFVLGQAGSASPAADGTAAPGTSARYARQDHVHPTDTSRAAAARQVATGTGLTGGGDLTADRTLSLATIAIGGVLSNVSGSIAAPTANTLTALLDNAFSSVQGAIIYRGASGWAALAAGTSGYVLQTGGAGANPAWVTPGAATVADGSITTVKLADSAVTTIKLNNNAVTMAKLVSPAAAGLIGATGATSFPSYLTPAQVAGILPVVGTDAAQTLTAIQQAQAISNIGLALPWQPTGRPTLVSGSPIMTSAVSAATAVYFTAGLMPIWNGTAFVPRLIPELSISTTGLAASNVYDLHAYDNTGTVALRFSPAWAAGTGGSNTVRGTGAGSAALTRVQGVPVNAVAISGGPAAGSGTFLGTIRTDTSGATVSWGLGGTGVGGVAATLNVWSMYNRRLFVPVVRDTNSSYTVNGGNRNYASSASMRIDWVAGLAEEGVHFDARTNVAMSNASLVYHLVAGLDGNDIYDAYHYGTTTQGLALSLSDVVSPALGAHSLQLRESAIAGSVTVNSNNTNAFTARIMA